MTEKQIKEIVEFKQRVTAAVLDPNAEEKPQIMKNGKWRDMTITDLHESSSTVKKFAKGETNN